MNFYGYKRPDGRVGVRNKVLILPASVCASDTTRIISQQVVGSVTFNNQLGCSQVAPDQQFTMDVMAGYAANPNVYGTVVVSLGCENCQMDLVVKAIQERTNKPLKQVIIQEAGGTLKAIDMAVRYAECRQRLSAETLLARLEQDEMKNQMKEAKEQRERLRQEHPDDAILEILTRESQFQKAELKRLKQHWNTRLLSLQAEIEAFETEIERLRTERKTRSAALQQRLFKQFQMLDACGRKRDLCDIFQDTAQKVPPAGAGECAAPKLLQYAYRSGLQPVAMAEFWWGDSPKNEIRRHGYYYPACKGKCEPILRHMLQGLQVEDNPLQNDSHRDTELEILYEDEWLLVVNKPAGMLSVPGKLDVDSVYQRVRRIYPEATGPMIVHRLDMATSGLLLIAKTKEVHQNLQAQFKNRTVRKRYVALLDGLVKRREGLIALPLRPDPEDRPRQVVDEVSGKPAVTLFETLICEAHRSRVLFFPQTGRTHQLRVHAAHPLGLDAPIVGDELYGKRAERLYLHAEYLAFRHPVSGRMIEVEKLAEF